jgi:hypothetical protein
MRRVRVLTLVIAFAGCAAPVQQTPIEPAPIEPAPTVAASASTASASAVTPAASPKVEPAPAAPPPRAVGAIWPPRMPSAGKFEEIPLGKWADYEETYLDAVTIRERVALVAREGDVVTLETTTETGSADKTVFVTAFAASQGLGWRPTLNVFQVGDQDPMESPEIGPAQQPYPAVDPKKLIGTEMIRVRVGSYRAKHYRYRTAYGEVVDYWIDDSVAPIGLIKLEAEQKQHAGFRAGFKFELVAVGSGAIAQVTKRARPFDAKLLQKTGMPWTRNARVGPQPPAKVVQ